MKSCKLLLIAVALSMCFASCKSSPTTTKGEETTVKIQEAQIPETKVTFSEPGKVTIDVNKKYVAVIHTSKGDITCELFAKDAPLSVTNFKQLADGGFYKGLTFHRVEPGFVIQGGDPTATGAGGPGYTIPAEINSHKHLQGALAWARTPDVVNPERRSSGSQFYVTLSPTPFLDGQYTVFGQTKEGMDVAQNIQPGDVIESVEVREE